MGKGRKQRIADAKDNLAKENISTAGLRGGQILRANKKVISSDVRENTTSAMDEFQKNKAVIAASKGPKVEVNVKDAFKQDQNQQSDQGIKSDIGVKSTNTNINPNTNINTNKNKAIGNYGTLRKFQDPTHKLIQPPKTILEEKLTEQFKKDMPKMGQTPKTGLEKENFEEIIKNSPRTTQPIKSVPRQREVEKDNTNVEKDIPLEQKIIGLRGR